MCIDYTIQYLKEPCVPVSIKQHKHNKEKSMFYHLYLTFEIFNGCYFHFQNLRVHTDVRSSTYIQLHWNVSSHFIISWNMQLNKILINTPTCIVWVLMLRKCVQTTLIYIPLCCDYKFMRCLLIILYFVFVFCNIYRVLVSYMYNYQWV